MSDCRGTFDVTTEGSNYTVSVMGFEATSPMEVICELYVYGTSTRVFFLRKVIIISQTVQAL